MWNVSGTLVNIGLGNACGLFGSDGTQVIA